MRTCGACKGRLRWDEGLSSQWMDGPGGPGLYVACPRCHAAALGQPLPAPAKYPPGEVPRHPLRDDLLPICGLCRESLFEGERTSPMRIAEQDVSAGGHQVEPGVYCACPRCLDQWRPIIRDRLAREGVIAEGAHAESLRGSVLL